MRRDSALRRFLALFLALGLSLPSPAGVYAEPSRSTLRTLNTVENAGLEQSLADTLGHPAGLEGVSYPKPVDVWEHPFRAQWKFMSYLNRHLEEIDWIQERVLPDVTQRKGRAGDRQITVAILGVSTGEEIARVLHAILPWMEARELPVHEDSPEQWHVRVLAIEKDFRLIEEAKRRLRGQSPFAYRKRPWEQWKESPGAKQDDALHEFIGTIIRTVERYTEMIHDRNNPMVEWSNRDMADPQAVRIAQQADLIVDNAASVYLDWRKGRALWRGLADSKAWIITTNEEFKHAAPPIRSVQLLQPESLHRFQPGQHDEHDYYLSPPPAAGLEQNVAAAWQEILKFIRHPDIQNTLRLYIETRMRPDEVLDLTNLFNEFISHERLAKAGFVSGKAQSLPPAVYRSAQPIPKALRVYVEQTKETAEWAGGVEDRLRQSEKNTLVPDISKAAVVVASRDIRSDPSQILIHVGSATAAKAVHPGLFVYLEGQGLLAIEGGVIFLHDGGLGEDVFLFA